VIGNEEKGVRPLIREKCDFSVSIPMEGEFDSLNASVAGAVIMFEVMRQRLYR
jgi:23S rRNA (guanosine2251-2'-O)-methyltransferase